MKLLMCITTIIAFSAIALPFRLIGSEAISENDIIKEIYPNGISGDIKVPHPLELTLEPSQLPISAGLANLRLKIISSVGCSVFTVVVSGIDNLVYTGDSIWNISTWSGDTAVIDLSVIIPENDTSGIGITAKCTNNFDNTVMCYFVSNLQGVSFYKGNPRRVQRTPIGVPRDMSDPPLNR